MKSEFLFSYGTLQLDHVQLATFGRQLTGKSDVLPGFQATPMLIEDPGVISISGKKDNIIAKFTGSDTDQIPGTVYALTSEELQSADRYEIAPYTRVSVLLKSGTQAWVYVDGRHAPPAS